MPYNKVVGPGTPEDPNTEQKVTYSQTIGGRFTYKRDRFYFDAATYFQGGNAPAAIEKTDLSAYYFSANAMNTYYHIDR